MQVSYYLKSIGRFWKNIFVLSVPIICLPLALQSGKNSDGEEMEKVFQCAYVMILMAVFWVTEALPLGVTSLMPVILLPLFEIMTTDAVGKEYLKETNLMFISGIVIAIAVEHCNLHKRIALKFLLFFGTSPRRLMLGFMVPTMFLSMWISNTATTAMMVPIVDAVLSELEKGAQTQEQNHNGNRKGSQLDLESLEPLAEQDQKAKNIRHMVFLSVAYSANAGGTGTLTGTGVNLVFKGALNEFVDSPVNFASWMGYAVAPMLLNLIFCWLWLQLFYIGFPWRKIFCKSPSKNGEKDNNETHIRQLLRSHYDSLGPMSFHESAVLCLFVTLIMLWVFREPQFIYGWGEFFHTSIKEYIPIDSNCHDNCTYIMKLKRKDAVDDASAGMLIVLLLFVIPKSFEKSNKHGEGLITWKKLEQRMPWELVFLLGGGFALAKGASVSGLSSFIGKKLEALDALPSWAIVVVVCIGTAAATEITSNVATCSIVLPILKNLALALRINPIYLMLPVTLCCSYAFMLPVATPPNAIVYKASGMKTSQMIKVGFGMNVICVTVNILWLQTFGMWYFNLATFPEWAEKRL